MTLDHHDQSIGIRKRQGTEQDRVLHAEDERAAGNSERETERRQHRGSLEPAQGEPEIVP